MTQQIRGMLVCLLVLSTIVGCGKTPETTTPQGTQGGATSKESTAPQNGWKKIAGEGVTLSLPANYEGGNPKTEIDEISKKLTAIAPSYAQSMDVIRQNPNAIAFLAFDPQSGKTGFLTNINITKEEVPQDVTVEQYLKAASQQIGNRYKVLEQKVVPLEQYQAGRITAEAKAGEITIKQLFYAVKNDKKFWLVMYSTTNDEFDKRLPDFEQSIRTFNVSQ